MAEFDSYAEGYAAGMDQPLKRLAGRSADDFIDVKTRWLLREVAARPPATLLDFGCGTGAMLRSLRRHGYAGGLHGCDVSTGMLARAREQSATDVVLSAMTGGRVDSDDQRFDAVVISAVLHHVPAVERAGVVREAARVLRPGGRLFVFEHNGRNPLVRLVVRLTPIDRDAVLLSAGEGRRLCRAAGLKDVRSRSLMFFPPRWTWAWPLERPLTLAPLGGQYVVAARK